MAVTDILKQLSGGMGVTLEIFFVTLITSLILGLGLALVRMSRFKILSILAKIYISIMRGTPLMLQLLVVYFGPYFIFGIPITSSYRLNAVLLGFSLNYAAYFAEIYRGGIAAVPDGQYEAAGGKPDLSQSGTGKENAGGGRQSMAETDGGFMCCQRGRRNAGRLVQSFWRGP